jgi:hypothetical protein
VLLGRQHSAGGTCRALLLLPVLLLLLLVVVLLLHPAGSCRGPPALIEDTRHNSAHVQQTVRVRVF